MTIRPQAAGDSPFTPSCPVWRNTGETVGAYYALDIANRESVYVASLSISP